MKLHGYCSDRYKSSVLGKWENMNIIIITFSNICVLLYAVPFRSSITDLRIVTFYQKENFPIKCIFTLIYNFAV